MIRIRVEYPGSYFRELRNKKTNLWVKKYLKLFDADLGSGWKKFGSGINIPDPQDWCHEMKSVGDPDPQHCKYWYHIFRRTSRF
jgi:hypothetical protein